MGPRDGQEGENIIRMMSVEPIASHLLPPSHTKDNLWKSYTQRGTTRGLPKQWRTGDQLRWPALHLGDDHNRVIPSSHYFFAHQSCGSGIVQSLIPSELSPLFSSLGLEFLSSLPLLSSVPWPLQFQSLDFGIPQSLGPFTLNSMVLGLFNPFIALELNPLAPSVSMPWLWDCSVPFAL